MSVNYNKIANKFANSRKSMKWEEIDYFIKNYISNIYRKKNLDIWCGSARLLEHLYNFFDISNIEYLWIDSSKDIIEISKKKFPKNQFLNLNMLELNKLNWKKFDYIFFIASFHHLEKIEDRLKVLDDLKMLLNYNWLIFFTNWSLDSYVNKDKYSKYIIKDSKNIFWSYDYEIPFWDYLRFYHWFTIDELNYIFEKTWYNIIENREFENYKNIISILW